MPPLRIPSLPNALLTFEIVRSGEKRRYRIDARKNDCSLVIDDTAVMLMVRELLPSKIADYIPHVTLMDDGCWSPPYRDPTPVLSIALRLLTQLFRPSSTEIVEWSSVDLMGGQISLLDLGTLEMEAVKFTPPNGGR